MIYFVVVVVLSRKLLKRSALCVQVVGKGDNVFVFPVVRWDHSGRGGKNILKCLLGLLV